MQEEHDYYTPCCKSLTISHSETELIKRKLQFRQCELNIFKSLHNF